MVSKIKLWKHFGLLNVKLTGIPIQREVAINDANLFMFLDNNGNLTPNSSVQS